MEATVRRRQRTVQSITKAWNLVKDLDDSQKLELVSMLIDSVKPKVAAQPPKRYTMDEINAMLDASEADITAGRVIDDEDLLKEDEEEYARELAEEQRLQLETA